MKHYARILAFVSIQKFYVALCFLAKLALKMDFVKAYQPIPLINLHIAEKRERGIRERWKAMERNLSGTHGSFLDVGCNLGYYIFKAAEHGNFAVGIDIKEYATILNIVKNYKKIDNLFGLDFKLSPQNIGLLPKFDTIVCLQIFHHFCAAYGERDGVGMLQAIWEKTNDRMFFEVEPSWRAKGLFAENMPDMKGDVKGWLIRTLNLKNSELITEIYFDEGHKRQLFCIRKFIDIDDA